MNHIRRGIAVTDLLAIAAILVLMAAIGVPTLERARELSKRAVCAVNLKALGGAGNVYADANKGQWMTPPFRRNTQGNGIYYACIGGLSSDPACVGFERHRETTSETQMHPSAGSTAMSTTRAYWMLVRSGDVSSKQLICPSSKYDSLDPTREIDLYYDFDEYKNISYGYLVPFGPSDTRPGTGADPRKLFAADKGPFYLDGYHDFQTLDYTNTPLEIFHTPREWARFNSRNHGGNGIGDGQNGLFADGHVEFQRKPIFGVDNDNIFTVMRNEWGALPYNRTHGNTPHEYPYSPFPGEQAFGSGGNSYSSTDSLIYP